MKRAGTYAVKAMLQYRDGQRANETMQSVAGALELDEIEALAAYFETLAKKNVTR